MKHTAHVPPTPRQAQPQPASAHLEREEGIADDLAAAPGSHESDQAQLQLRSSTAQGQAQQDEGGSARGGHQVHHPPQNEEAGGHLRGCGQWVRGGGRQGRCVADVGQARRLGQIDKGHPVSVRVGTDGPRHCCGQCFTTLPPVSLPAAAPKERVVPAGACLPADRCTHL